jgi:hypothetical protein
MYCVVADHKREMSRVSLENGLPELELGSTTSAVGSGSDEPPRYCACAQVAHDPVHNSQCICVDGCVHLLTAAASPAGSAGALFGNDLPVASVPVVRAALAARTADAEDIPDPVLSPMVAPPHVHNSSAASSASSTAITIGVSPSPHSVSLTLPPPPASASASASASPTSAAASIDVGRAPFAQANAHAVYPPASPPAAAAAATTHVPAPIVAPKSTPAAPFAS